MRKIPTVFERDWEGDRSRVLDKVTPGCEWVLAGEGTPTRKYDGQAALVSMGNLFKRHEVKPGRERPAAFLIEEADAETGAVVGWVPVGDGPEDRWFREAFEAHPGLPDGTYELVGPKVQGNPERFERHMLIRHRDAEMLPDAPRSFDLFEAYFRSHDVEGIVWHHPYGQMAKLKARDLGVRRPSATPRA